MSEPAMNECPYCGHKVKEGDTWAEVAHMQVAHPDVIAERLAEIGVLDAGVGFDARAAQDPIPNAWGQPGVGAIYVDVDAEDKSEEPRKLVCIDTAMCETALSVEGAEEFLRRVYDVVAEIRHGDEARAHREAGERGEHYLEDVRDELGPAAFNSLRRGKVLTIEQVQRLSDAELLAIPNLGAVRLARIREVCGPDATRPRSRA